MVSTEVIGALNGFRYFQCTITDDKETSKVDVLYNKCRTSLIGRSYFAAFLAANEDIITPEEALNFVNPVSIQILKRYGYTSFEVPSSELCIKAYEKLSKLEALG